MAEFKVYGKMTVRELKERFKEEFEGTLQILCYKEPADDSATLASIRRAKEEDAEFVCYPSNTVSFARSAQTCCARSSPLVLAMDGFSAVCCLFSAFLLRSPPPRAPYNPYPRCASTTLL